MCVCVCVCVKNKEEYIDIYIYIYIYPSLFYGPVTWGCRIHRLHLCRHPGYDTKQSHDEAPVMLEL